MAEESTSGFDFAAEKPPEPAKIEYIHPTDEDPVLLEKVREAIKTVKDPEIPMDLIELGLIYKTLVGTDGLVYVAMTLTSAGCPVAGGLPDEVQQAIAKVDGVTKAQVELVWHPGWHPGRMSEAARLELGIVY